MRNITEVNNPRTLVFSHWLAKSSADKAALTFSKPDNFVCSFILACRSSASQLAYGKHQVQLPLCGHADHAINPLITTRQYIHLFPTIFFSVFFFFLAKSTRKIYSIACRICPLTGIFWLSYLSRCLTTLNICIHIVSKSV